MNTIHIVVEGQTDKILLENLLSDFGKSLDIRFHVAGGKNAAHSLARSLQVRLEEPVALVLDADTNDQRTAEEEQAMYESYLGYTSKGVPFIVILAIPEIENIFFKSPAVLRNMIGKRLEPKDILIGKLAPKQYLAELGEDWVKAFFRLDSKQLSDLRTVEPVINLRTFLLEMVNLIADYETKAYAVD